MTSLFAEFITERSDTISGMFLVS